MEESKPVVTEKYDFKNRGNSIQKSHFILWDYRDFHAKNKMKKIPMKSCSLSPNFVIEIFMKEIKRVVGEKNEFE